MKIFGFPMSGPSRSVKTLCIHAKIEHEWVEVFLPKGEQRSDEHLQRNPHGKVPALEDGDHTVFESIAILKYICDTKLGDTPLYPKDPKKRAKVNEKLSMFNDFKSEMSMLGGIRFHFKIKGLPAPPELIQKNTADKFFALFDKFEKSIACKKTILEDLTILDIVFVENIFNGYKVLNIDLEKEYPNTNAYVNAVCEQIPSLRESEK